MNSYKMSNGERVTKSTIDKRIRWAKSYVIEKQLIDWGYNFCEDCGISSGTYLDCSHIVSVKQCQEIGKSELAWDVNNIRILCREHHIEHDNKPNNERHKLFCDNSE